jgi:hypothetical protein
VLFNDLAAPEEWCDTYFNIGQRYAIAYIGGANGGFLAYTTRASRVAPFYIYTYAVDTDTSTEEFHDDTMPLAFCFGMFGGSMSLFQSGIVWSEFDLGRSVCYLRMFTVGSSSYGEDYWNSEYAPPADYYKTIISLFFSSNGILHGCYLRRDRVYGSKYQTFAFNPANGHRMWDLPLSSAMPFGGFVQDGTYIYYLDMGNGQLYRQSDVDPPSVTIELQGGGIPAVDAESCLLAGLAVKTGTPPTFYGISSPTPLTELNSSIPTGKYYLFQFANVLTDRVELGDFSGLNKWDALKLLARRCLCTMGFNLDGEFYFKPIPSGTPTETLVGPDMEPVEPTEYACASIQREPGLDEIFNVVELFPCASVLKNPDCVLERGSSSSIASEVIFQQRDIAAKNIYLYCVAGGRVLNDNALNKLRFRWILEDSLFETSLRVASNASDAYIDVYSVKDVSPGDYVQVQDSGDKIVSSVDTANNRINLTTTIGAIYSIGATVLARKSGYRYTSDHKDGVTQCNGASGTGVQIGVYSTANLSIGTVIRLESSAGVEECRIVSVDDDLHVTVTRGIAGTVAVNHPNYTPVRAFWSPNDQTKFFEIGQTRVDLKIVDQADASTHEETEARRTFQVGDRFRITCAGASLEKIDMAKQTAIDTPSVNKYGRLVYPDSDNRFLNYSYASELAPRLRDEYANPKFKVLSAGPLLPWALPNGLMYVKSKKIFPGESNYRVACRITQANLDPRKKNGTWQMRALTSYSY